MEASTNVSKESLEGQAMCGRVSIPVGIHWEDDIGSCELKPKMQGIPQNVGIVKNVEHPPRTVAAMSGYSPRKPEVGCNQQGLRGGAAQVYFAQITTSCPPDARHGAIGFNVFPTEFWSFFSPILPFYNPIPPFWNWECLLCVTVSWEVRNFLFYFIGTQV
jgi:hypothetical protein